MKLFIKFLAVIGLLGLGFIGIYLLGIGAITALVAFGGSNGGPHGWGSVEPGVPLLLLGGAFITLWLTIAGLIKIFRKKKSAD